ncbi:MAG: hypothetical protein IKP65_03225 [Alphaproteobacteria bacterium]|nr:hypothetical protein [Alphaproteobacteria bacterium]
MFNVGDIVFYSNKHFISTYAKILTINSGKYFNLELKNEYGKIIKVYAWKHELYKDEKDYLIKSAEKKIIELNKKNDDLLMEKGKNDNEILELKKYLEKNK